MTRELAIVFLLIITEPVGSETAVHADHILTHGVLKVTLALHGAHCNRQCFRALVALSDNVCRVLPKFSKKHSFTLCQLDYCQLFRSPSYTRLSCRVL